MRLTEAGRATAFVTGVFFLIALLHGSVGMMALASVGPLVLCLAALRSATALAYISAGDLRCRLWIESRHATGTIHVGDDAHVVLQFEPLPRAALHGLALHGFAVTGLSLATERVITGDLRRGTERTARVRCRAVQTGEHAIHGMFLSMTDALGLVRVETWLRLQLALRIVPRPAGAHPIERIASSRRVTSVGGGVTDPRGREPTVELRQLREYRTGDPLRTIAWKATARRGKMVVRELETERPLSLHLALDVGPGQRGAPDGVRLEAAFAVTWALASQTLRAGGTCGLTSFDTRPLGAIEGLRGRTGGATLLQHLLYLRAPWSERQSDWTEDELADRVALFLRVQHGSDAFVGPSGTVDSSILERVVSSQFGAEVGDTRRRALVAGLDVEGASALRVFAQARRLPEPWRRSFEATERASVLAEIVREHGASRSQAPLLVLTDLGAMQQLRELQDAITFAVGRRHRVLFALAYAPDDISRADEPDPVRVALDLAEAHRRQAQLRTLRGAGAEVVSLDSAHPGRTVRALVQTLRGPRRPFRIPSGAATRPTPS